MQAFISGLSAQCRSHKLRAEIVLVEWNPPPDRMRLHEILFDPGSDGWLNIRIIEVPRKIHRTLGHSESLNLYQMIAKNVGIRRARGRYVLATNVDILFSDEMIRYLADEGLQESRYYRADRYDVPYDVPSIPTVEAQLAYCRQNLLRINRKAYSVDLRSGKVLRIYPESKQVEDFRRLLWFLGPLIALEFLGRTCGPVLRRMRQQSKRRSRDASAAGRIARGWRTLRKNRLRVDPRFSYIVPLRKINDLRVWTYPFITSLGSSLVRFDLKPNPRFLEIASEILTLPSPRRPQLHTNASGDFTLMSKESWNRVRGYPEFHTYSLHIDSILLYQVHFEGIKEVCLKFPIYHIDHAKGWAPFYFEQDKFYDTMKRGMPSLTYADFLRITEPMVTNQKAIMFNGPDWGLANYELQERNLPPLPSNKGSTT